MIENSTNQGKERKPIVDTKGSIISSTFTDANGTFEIVGASDNGKKIWETIDCVKNTETGEYIYLMRNELFNINR